MATSSESAAQGREYQRIYTLWVTLPRYVAIIYPWFVPVSAPMPQLPPDPVTDCLVCGAARFSLHRLFCPLWRRRG